MTTGAWVLLAVAAALAAGDWVAVGTSNRRLEYACKPLTMVSLIGVALALDPTTGDAGVRAWFVAALVLSLAGDVFLMLPADLFVAGLGAFLAGHLAYIAGLNVDGTTARWWAAGTMVVLVALATVGRRVLTAVRAGAERAMTMPVAAYMTVISVMVASAIGTGEALAAGGAVLFYCSDALIAWTRFVCALRWGRLAIIVTYHAAQVGLVLSLTR